MSLTEVFLSGREKARGESILFMSHQDVVEASGEWKHELSGEIADGAVWGKRNGRYQGQSLFLLLQAMEELIAKDYVPAWDFALPKQLYRGAEVGEWRASYRINWLQDNGVHLKLLWMKAE